MSTESKFCKVKLTWDKLLHDTIHTNEEREEEVPQVAFRANKSSSKKLIPLPSEYTTVANLYDKRNNIPLISFSRHISLIIHDNDIKMTQKSKKLF